MRTAGIKNPPNDLIVIDKETEDRLVEAVSAKFATLPEGTPYQNKMADRYKSSIISNLRSDQVSSAAGVLNDFVTYGDLKGFTELQALLEEYDDNYDHQEMASNS